MAVGVHVPLRFLRAAIKKGISVLKERIPTANAQQTSRALEPVYARVPTQNSRLPYGQRVKVAQRWYSTTSINNALCEAGFKDVAPKVAKSPVRHAVGRLTTTTPFASTLRPKLVGGAFPRSSGGYSLGGSARFFSHTPTAPAQVISQVVAAMRVLAAKGKMEGLNYGTNGRAAVRAQLAAKLVDENAPGAHVDFYLSPTLTCLSPLNARQNSLGDEEFMESLGADFGAMLGGLTAIYSDIKKLSQRGALPITLAGPASDIIRVHFRGRSGQDVEAICNELGIRRGVVYEEERFAIGLLAPEYGEPPGSWKDMMSDSPPASSTYSEDGFDETLSEAESYGASDYFDIDADVSFGTPTPDGSSVGANDDPEEIYRFLENFVEHRSGYSAYQ
ncbi:hypothetical protein L873DRAFT_1684246 [Choiromyces venosus 120613-1]|uniref:Casein kinase II beta 2 subunit n=1 Tax=Choiromyces venosus 120613-1 TaxID=1336337 RepID=A0A3N4JQP3_9PEZI|nr:hypothetical protein L873DRAFT_1684246 [Choiromyces venosus 120613-1]